jgi:hypothetical protein
VAGEDNSALAPPAAEPAAAMADLPGEAVYDQACVACHGAGIAGAPKFGDKAAWAAGVMQRKGYAEAPAGTTPDLRIAYETASADKIENNPVRVGIGVGSWGGNVGGSVNMGSPSIRNYTEGTLVIHAIDAARNAEVWQGRVSGKMTKGSLEPRLSTRPLLPQWRISRSASRITRHDRAHRVERITAQTVSRCRTEAVAFRASPSCSCRYIVGHPRTPRTRAAA